MDPKETLKFVESHISQGEFAEAIAALLNYYQWRSKGGFEPAGGDEQADTLGSILVNKAERIESAIETAYNAING